jgi:hypothetical protein
MINIYLKKIIHTEQFETITIGSTNQIEKLLTTEDIPFEIMPAYKGCNENIIRCLNSSKWKQIIENDQSNFALNGIRLFEYY